MTGPTTRVTRNNNPVAMDVRPVRPPATTPAALSMELTLDVPAIEPVIAASESASRMRSMRGRHKRLGGRRW